MAVRRHPLLQAPGTARGGIHLQPFAEEDDRVALTGRFPQRGCHLAECGKRVALRPLARVPGEAEPRFQAIEPADRRGQDVADRNRRPMIACSPAREPDGRAARGVQPIDEATGRPTYDLAPVLLRVDVIEDQPARPIGRRQTAKRPNRNFIRRQVLTMHVLRQGEGLARVLGGPEPRGESPAPRRCGRLCASAATKPHLADRRVRWPGDGVPRPCSSCCPRRTDCPGSRRTAPRRETPIARRAS